MGIGPWHLLALVIIVLVFFGPSRLPGLGKSVGEAIRGFKKGLDNDEIDVTDSAKERRENLNPSQDDHVTQAQKQQSKNNRDS